MATADTLTARQGDTLDALLWRERGLSAADLPRVLSANPGLADHGPVLPMGTRVIAPETMAPAQRTRAVTNLWD